MKSAEARRVEFKGGLISPMESKRTITGIIFNIQRFSIQDGPGIRTTVFLKGCPLRCLWCSNPESQSSIPEVAHRDSLCNGCANCLKACDQEAISLTSNNGGSTITIDRERCTNCGRCVDTCTAGALRVYGQTMSIDEVLDEVRRDMAYYSNSGGGITVGGGEPLSQADFVAELFRRCRNIGIHTIIDTCGYGNVSDLEKVLPQTDLVLYDLKVMNSKEHRKFTKKFNKVILHNIRLIVEREVPMIIRIPFIPGVNVSKENLSQIARFVSELDRGRHVDLLPYHRFGESKYKMLDRPYELTGVKPPDEEQLERALEILRQFNLDCAIQE